MGILFLISTLQICSDSLSRSVAWLTPRLKQMLPTDTEDTEDTATWDTLDTAALLHMLTPLDPTFLMLSSMCPMVMLLPASTVLLTLVLFTLLRGLLMLRLLWIRRIRRIRPPGLRWIRRPCCTCSLHWTPPNVVQHVPYGYAASGVYRAANAGALHLAKRSADADAVYGYGGYGYAGPVTSGLSTVSHAGFPLQGYAQGYGYGLW